MIHFVTFIILNLSCFKRFAIFICKKLKIHLKTTFISNIFKQIRKNGFIFGIYFYAFTYFTLQQVLTYYNIFTCIPHSRFIVKLFLKWSI